MIRFAVDILALVAAFVAGGFFEPKVATWFKSWTAARAVTAAKALVAKAEADAKALEAARKVVASQAVTSAVTTPKTGA